MVGRSILQSRSALPIFLANLWVLGLCYVAVTIYNEPSTALRHSAVIASAEMVVALMVIGWALMLANPLGENLARFVWTLGLISLLIHIFLAIWLAHGWSHEAAVEHVREVGGFGGGILFSYLFALLWLADVAWWWINSRSRANRPPWVGWAIHGYMTFIVLNATVVFGEADRRGVYAAIFAALGILACCRLMGFGKRRR
jgi:hypothetical protein